MKKKVLAAFIGIGISMSSIGTSSAADTCDDACFNYCDNQLSFCLYDSSNSKRLCFNEFKACISR
jgi:hypothetical protein